MSENNDTHDNTDTDNTSEEEISEEDKPVEAVAKKSHHHLLTAALGLVLFVVVFASAMFIELPLYTYEAEQRSYSRTALAKSTMVQTMAENEKIKMAEEYGIDFSKLLVPEQMESTQAMQNVAKICLPEGSYTLHALSKTAAKAFSQATNYMVCAVKTHETRLCEPYQKQRLVEQLMEYLDIQQHMIAMEQARLKIVKENGTATPAPTARPSFNEKLDPRIGNGLKKLTQNGYISPTDFGWYGLVLPRKYAPYISGGVIGTNVCG